MSDCTDCPVNTYCSGVANTVDPSTTTNKCDPGFTCPAKSTHPRHTVCPLGFKCPQADATSTACDPTQGKYQDRKGAITCNTCPVGYLCDATSATRCTPQTDTTSYYCITNGASKAARKVSCPSGKYTYKDRASSSSDCLSCPKGNYCPATAATSITKIVACPAGYYCLEGAYDTANAADTNSAVCPEGFYCPEGTYIPIPCTQGSYCAGT
jgi:hypothetical protein